MGRVFDHMEMVAVGERLNSVHIAGLSGKMNREDGASPAGNLLPSFLGIDTKRYGSTSTSTGMALK